MDTFFPKCFDVSEQADYEEFILYIKLIKAESVIKQYISGDKVPELRAKVALNVCLRRLKSLDEIIEEPNSHI